MLNATGIKSYERIPFTGRDAGELERKADSLGLKNYRVNLDGGVVRYIKIGGMWVTI